MRAFSIVVACSALVAGVAWISIASKFRELYEQMGVSLPNFTSTIVNTSGWIPAGILIVSAVLLIVLIIGQQPKVAGILAVLIALFLIGTAVVLPRILVAPLSGVIQDLEADQRNRQAEQVGADQPATAPESKAE